MTPLVLGSASARRRDLLASVGFQFTVVTADIDESVISGETPEAYLERIARAKLDAVTLQLGEVLTPCVVLVADTAVVVENRILGKPHAFAENVAMMRLLVGRVHQVMTRYAIGHVAKGSQLRDVVERTVTTRVWMRDASDELVEQYAAGGEGWDKAGGYAVQGTAAMFVSRVDGSYSNVVGLPLCEVFEDLAHFGVNAQLGSARRA